MQIFRQFDVNFPLPNKSRKLRSDQSRNIISKNVPPMVHFEFSNVHYVDDDVGTYLVQEITMNFGSV